jgi:hypothetical protein
MIHGVLQPSFVAFVHGFAVLNSLSLSSLDVPVAVVVVVVVVQGLPSLGFVRFQRSVSDWGTTHGDAQLICGCDYYEQIMDIL